MTNIEQLEKCVWTDADFEVMGWHDCRVHAIAAQQVGKWVVDAVLDIDYISQWVPVSEGRKEFFHFGVAPATLVFHDVIGLAADFDVDLANTNELYGIERNEHPNAERAKLGYIQWTLDGLTKPFAAKGYTQHFRSQPIELEGRQHLTMDERGGLSFARPEQFPANPG